MRWLVCLLLLTAACQRTPVSNTPSPPTKSPDADEPITCAQDADCPIGFRCDSRTGLCLCASDAVCRSDEYCAPDGTCQFALSTMSLSTPTTTLPARR